MSRQWFWNLYGKHIIKKFRSNYPDLPQVKGQIPTTEVQAIRMGLIPTFGEFVDYVIDIYPRGDPHWAPLTEQIDFCKLNYKYIFKLETLMDELPDVLPQIGITGQLDLTDIRNIGGHRTTGKTKKSLESFLEELSDKQKRGLSIIYKNDFDAFNPIYTNPFLTNPV